MAGRVAVARHVGRIGHVGQFSDARKLQHFVVAEDVITRGGRVQEVIDIVNARGGVVEAIAVLVDRSGGRAQFKAPVFSLLQWEPMTWEPANCPMCKQGSKAVHPGS